MDSLVQGFRVEAPLEPGTPMQFARNQMMKRQITLLLT